MLFPVFLYISQYMITTHTWYYPPQSTLLNFDSSINITSYFGVLVFNSREIYGATIMLCTLHNPNGSAIYVLTFSDTLKTFFPSYFQPSHSTLSIHPLKHLELFSLVWAIRAQNQIVLFHDFHNPSLSLHLIILVNLHP